MIKIAIFAFAVLLLPFGRVIAQAPAKPADLTTLSGKTYKQARVFRVEPDGITYMYAGGMSKIDFTDLPEAIRKQYNFDPAKAAAFAAQDDKEQAAIFRAQASAVARADETKVMDHLRDIGMSIEVEVVQVTDEGVLGTAKLIHAVKETVDVPDPTGLALNRTRPVETTVTKATPLDKGEMIMVRGAGAGLADGETWAGKVWPRGTYRYTSVTGATRTVRQYFCTPEDALAPEK